LSRVELESFLKSFLLFFSSLSLLILTLFYLNYLKEVKNLDETLFSQMRVCSFDLKCKKFKIDFVDKKKQELYTLYKNRDGLDGFFPINSSKKYLMQLHFPSKYYKKQVSKIKKDIFLQVLITIFVLFILSILFALYTISPLRKALHLTQEFIKDILHDFNTPLATLRLNSSMLKREIGENEKISRIEMSVENIISLQENLKAYLYNHKQQKELVDIKKLINSRILLIQKSYEDISFFVQMQEIKIYINLPAFTRIIDNLLSNAAKYNKKDGKITITYEKSNNTLLIKDTGKGIKNPNKIFERFYKEQERGIGIGLHIVKKLCDELHIKIKVDSMVGIGTTFSLKLPNSHFANKSM